MRSKLSFSLFLTLLIPCSAAERLPLSKQYWKSKSFLAAFNGSYKINAQIEPFVTTAERGLLVEVQGLMAKGEREAALAKLKASALSKTSAAVKFNTGNIAFELGDLDEAKKYYAAAIKEFPSFLRAKQNLAFVYAREGKYDDAFPLLLDAIKLGSQEGSVMGMVGYCYQQKENFTSALQAFKNAQLTEPDNIEWKIGEAYCYDSLGENQKALNLYETIVKERPDAIDYRLLLVNLYQRVGQVEDAIVNLEILRRQKKLDVSNLYLLGALHLSDGSDVIGANVIREVLKSDKLKDADIALNAVDFVIDRGQMGLAAEFHSLISPQLTEKGEAQQRYKRLKARMLILTKKDEENAEVILKELIKADPLDADSLYWLAQYEVTQNEKDLALLHFQQAYTGNGKYKHSALLERGKLLVSMQRYDEALQDLKKYQDHAEGLQAEQLQAYITAVENLVQASE